MRFRTTLSLCPIFEVARHCRIQDRLYRDFGNRLPNTVRITHFQDTTKSLLYAQNVIVGQSAGAVFGEHPALGQRLEIVSASTTGGGR